MKVTKKSPLTGQVNSMDLDITEEQIKKFKDGALIQNAFPNLTADEREFLLTGYTPEDWKEMFPDEEDH